MSDWAFVCPRNTFTNLVKGAELVFLRAHYMLGGVPSSSAYIYRLNHPKHSGISAHMKKGSPTEPLTCRSRDYGVRLGLSACTMEDLTPPQPPTPFIISPPGMDPFHAKKILPAMCAPHSGSVYPPFSLVALLQHGPTQKCAVLSPALSYQLCSTSGAALLRLDHTR